MEINLARDEKPNLMKMIISNISVSENLSQKYNH